MKLIYLIAGFLFVASTSLYAEPTQKSSEPVKKSSSGICHAPDSSYYSRTKKFTPYQTLDECLKSGGRLPKK